MSTTLLPGTIRNWVGSSLTTASLAKINGLLAWLKGYQRLLHVRGEFHNYELWGKVIQACEISAPCFEVNGRRFYGKEFKALQFPHTLRLNRHHRKRYGIELTHSQFCTGERKVEEKKNVETA